jgi:hypothetical protein
MGILDKILKHFDSKYSDGRDACKAFKLADMFDVCDD